MVWDNGPQGWNYGMGGCESGFTLPDPANPDIVRAGDSVQGMAVDRSVTRADGAAAPITRPDR